MTIYLQFTEPIVATQATWTGKLEAFITAAGDHWHCSRVWHVCLRAHGAPNFQKVDQHTGGKWWIHGTEHRKDNQSRSLE